VASLACPVCGEGLATGAPFCPECGQIPAYRSSANRLALAPATTPKLLTLAGPAVDRLPHVIVALVVSLVVGFGVLAAARQLRSAPALPPAPVPATISEADRIREEMRAAEAELRAKLRTLEERVQEAESKKRQR
jgi:hypothetical protein